MIRILFALITLVPASAMAAQVCTEVPDGVQYESITNNFDGSITINEPRVLVGGEYIGVYRGDVTPIGFCKVLDRKLVQSQIEYLGESENMASIDEGGNFSGITSATKLVKWITCK